MPQCSLPVAKTGRLKNYDALSFVSPVCASEYLEQLVSRSMNVAGAERENEVARPGDFLQPCSRAREPADIFDVVVAESLDLFGQRAAGYSFNRILARGVNICDKQNVSAVKRASELILQVASATVSMWLKQGNNPPAAGPRRSESSLDLRRMMAVIVDDQHAVLLAFDLEPALGPAKLGKHPGDV